MEERQDLISRQTAKPRYIDANEIPYCEVLDADTHKGTGRFMADKKDIDALPSAEPYTDEEIQKMQDLEQAQLDKAYELGRQSAQPEPNALEQEYLKGWEDGRKNLLDAVSGTLVDFCDQCGEGKKYNGVMCGACNLDSWMSAIEEMKCTIEGERITDG